MDGQRPEPQGPVGIEEGLPLHGVISILDHKVDRRAIDPDTGKKGLLKFLINWEDFEHPTWEPHFNITGCQSHLTEYYLRHPDAPKRQSMKLTDAHEEQMAVVWVLAEMVGDAGPKD